MPSLTVIRDVFRELIFRKDSFRVPEPALIMNSPEQVAAFHDAGSERGVMAPVYIFHAAQISEVIAPGNTVLDLGCGPANQLGLVARVNPDVRFIGIDLSAEMLSLAGKNLQSHGINNVELRRADITDLGEFDTSSVDAVMTTVVLHHLPDQAALFRCLGEIGRVLKPKGGIYLVDFGHLKTEAAIRSFAYQYADKKPEVFTIDYLNSLRAAFELETWREGYRRYLVDYGQLYSTFPIPFMVAVKSAPKRPLPDIIRRELRSRRSALPRHHKSDIKDLSMLFKLGGLPPARF